MVFPTSSLTTYPNDVPTAPTTAPSTPTPTLVMVAMASLQDMLEYINPSMVAHKGKHTGLQLLSTPLPSKDSAPVFEGPRTFQEKIAIGRAGGKASEAAHKRIIETVEVMHDLWNNRRPLERLCYGVVPMMVAGASPTRKLSRPFRAASTTAAMLGVWALLLDPVAGEVWSGGGVKNNAEELLRRGGACGSQFNNDRLLHFFLD